MAPFEVHQVRVCAQPSSVCKLSECVYENLCFELVVVVFHSLVIELQQSAYTSVSGQKEFSLRQHTKRACPMPCAWLVAKLVQAPAHTQDTQATVAKLRRLEANFCGHVFVCVCVFK